MHFLCNAQDVLSRIPHSLLVILIPWLETFEVAWTVISFNDLACVNVSIIYDVYPHSNIMWLLSVTLRLGSRILCLLARWQVSTCLALWSSELLSSKPISQCLNPLLLLFDQWFLLNFLSSAVQSTTSRGCIPSAVSSFVRSMISTSYPSSNHLSFTHQSAHFPKTAWEYLLPQQLQKLFLSHLEVDGIWRIIHSTECHTIAGQFSVVENTLRRS